MPLCLGPASVHPRPHNGRITAVKLTADILGKGKVRIPIGIKIIIENPANPARFVAVRQPEIFIAPFFEAVVVKS